MVLIRQQPCAPLIFAYAFCTPKIHLVPVKPYNTGVLYLTRFDRH